MVDDSNSNEISKPTRRALLGSAAVGASGLIAGCGYGDDGTETQGGTSTATDTEATEATSTKQDDLAHVSGQTLNYFMEADPQNITWFGTGVFPGPQDDYAVSRAAKPFDISWPSPVWGPWVNAPVRGEINNVHYELYDSVEVTDTEVTVEIKDDANWSNGDPVTPGDALGCLMAFRMFLNLTPPDRVADQGWGIPTDAITDYEVVSDKEFKLLSPHGGFGNLSENVIWTDYLQRRGSWAGIRGNTSMEPWKSWWSGIEDLWDQAKNGEIHPWTSQEDHDTNMFNATKELMFGDHGWSADPEENDYDNHWEKHFSKPENIVVTGAWKPKAINASKNITFEPNPEYVYADQVNFDELKLTRRTSGRASRAALKANTQDYYRGDVSAHTSESFPDDIEQRQTPTNSGLCFGFNHRHKLFSNVKARQAIMHAIDTERLAKSVHRTKFDPVTIPGGHGYTTRKALGDDFVDNTLQTYGRDIEKADQLMREAGFSKEGGKWQDSDGNALSVSVATSKDTPTLEPSFASQLSTFGIDAGIQTYSDSVFTEKKDTGELDMWTTDFGIGYALSIARLFQLAIVSNVRAENHFRMYPEEQVESANYAESGIITPATDEGFEPYSIQAPPVGEPDGELQTYRSAVLAWNAYRSKSQQEYKESLRKCAWLYNWFVPAFPIANGRTQHFVDTAHWRWPDASSEIWNGIGVQELQPEQLVGLGKYVSADPDNPEQGANVQD